MQCNYFFSSFSCQRFFCRTNMVILLSLNWFLTNIFITPPKQQLAPPSAQLRNVSCERSVWSQAMKLKAPPVALPDLSLISCLATLESAIKPWKRACAPSLSLVHLICLDVVPTSSEESRSKLGSEESSSNCECLQERASLRLATSECPGCCPLAEDRSL